MKPNYWLHVAVCAAALTLFVSIETAHSQSWTLTCGSGDVFTWQAEITDSTGNPIAAGDYELIYCYYEDSVGGSPIGCCVTTATVRTAFKSLGNGRAADASVATAQMTYAQPIFEDTVKSNHLTPAQYLEDYWAELTFDGELISPRTRITDVPNSGSTRRVFGDFVSVPGQAVIRHPNLVSTGALNLKANDSLSAVMLFEPGGDTIPEMVIQTTQLGPTLSMNDSLGNTRVSLTGEGMATFDDTVWTKTGYKFPDGSVQTTAATGGCNWTVTDTVLYTNNFWGIARGSAENALIGDSARTMINFGVACTTGTVGQNRSYSTVSGGYGNVAGGERGTVAGGLYNNAQGRGSMAGGGYGNTSSGWYSGVFSGLVNTAGDSAAFVGGGSDNSASGKWASVSGGENNSAGGAYSTVCGGRNNVIIADQAVVSGGQNNSASAIFSTVSGGHSNIAGAQRSTVGGGAYNRARGSYSVVAGGGGPMLADSNLADGEYSVVSGGRGNINTGDYSVILGGYDDTIAVGGYSMVFGTGVWVSDSFEVHFYDGTTPGSLRLNRDNRDGYSTHPIHVGTNTGNGNGAYLTGGGAWTNGSSREFKENFRQLDGQDVLERIRQLPIESWEYQGTGERHIWPCAEEFHERFDVGTLQEDGTRDTKYLAAGDVAGVALIGVQELYQITTELQQKTEELDNLKGQVAQLQALVETLLAERNSSFDGGEKLAAGDVSGGTNK